MSIRPPERHSLDEQQSCHYRLSRYSHHRERGAAAVEFALVAVFGGLFILLLGVFELGRVLYLMNTANEATVLGARVAIVCGMGDARILQRMQQVMPILTANDVTINYSPAGCSASGASGTSVCRSVSVSIAPTVKIKTVVPFVPAEIPLPAFATTLTREAMDSAECG
jgi:Flp pilus assembly protein TadG